MIKFHRIVPHSEHISASGSYFTVQRARTNKNSNAEKDENADDGQKPLEIE